MSRRKTGEFAICMRSIAIFPKLFLKKERSVICQAGTQENGRKMRCCEKRFVVSQRPVPTRLSIEVENMDIVIGK